MRHTEDFRYSTILLQEARAVRFNNFVSPGKSLLVTATVHERDQKRYVLKGSGTVDGQSAVSARLTLEQFNPGDTDPRCAAADGECIAHMRELFRQIWTPVAASAGESNG
jgi:3-hydroxyacyl-[acyl-carrier-protein] dehydratase